MSTADIRHKLVEFITFADDKKLNKIYKILENEIEEKHDIWTKEFTDEMNRRSEDYESGKTKAISKEEFFKKADDRINKR
jgi:putative addiction module component (TIGR02574 family)